MSEIQRLIRVAAGRNAREEYTNIDVRLLKTDLVRLKEKLAREKMSLRVVLEATVRGYVDGHPAVMAMIDRWISEELPHRIEQREGPTLPKREVDELLGGLNLSDGMIEED